MDNEVISVSNHVLTSLKMIFLRFGIAVVMVQSPFADKGSGVSFPKLMLSSETDFKADNFPMSLETMSEIDGDINEKSKRRFLRYL